MAHSKPNSSFEKHHGTKINNRGSLLNISWTRKAKTYGNSSKIYTFKLMVFMRVISSVIQSPAV